MTLIETVDQAIKTSSSQSEPSSASILPEHEVHLIQLLTYWLPRTSKQYENTRAPTNHAELMEFIAQIFASFQKEEQECWNQLSNLHLMTPQMLNLYQKKYIQVQSMNWIQLLCYKAVGCPNGKECRSYREQKMLHNQFYDFELECPHFHDIKDKRRLVLPTKPDEEFKYKGKYQEVSNEENFEDSFSHNYFESVFHPLFYKFFECKRLQCRGSIYCPMKHSEEERVAWEEEFSLCWKKDRSIYYPKKKKNSSDFSDSSLEEKLGFPQQQQQPQQKYHRPANGNSHGNNNMRFNPQQQQQYMNNRKFHGNNNNNNMMQAGNGRQNYMPRDNFYDKQQRYNKGMYDQQQQHQQLGFSQEFESPEESKFLKMFFNQPNNGQFVMNNNMKPAYDNSQFLGYNNGQQQQFNQNYQANNTNFNGLRLPNENPAMNSYQGGYNTSNNFSQGGNYQEDDGCGLDFDSIFSANNQYSQPPNVVFPEENARKQGINGYNTRKVFYPLKINPHEESHIEVQ